MGIENRIPMREVEAAIKKKIKASLKAITNTHKYIGEMCVNEARNNGDYIDQTGNLRSSIGYVVVRDGSILHKNFKQSERGTERGKGVREAERFARELAAKYNKGLVLIVVAGMNYATHVESRRNVLASAHILAQKETPRMLREVGFRKAA